MFLCGRDFSYNFVQATFFKTPNRKDTQRKVFLLVGPTKRVGGGGAAKKIFLLKKKKLKNFFKKKKTLELFV